MAHQDLTINGADSCVKFDFEVYGEEKSLLTDLTGVTNADKVCFINKENRLKFIQNR